MSTHKLGVYYDLPEGGAKRLMDTFIAGLLPHYELVRIEALPVPTGRLRRDLFNFVGSYFYSYQQNQAIKQAKLEAILVSHDSLFAAPTILRTCRIPTLFYCHEPTRALFEPELGVDSSWPLPNRLYEIIYRQIKKFLEQKNASCATKILTNSSYTQKYVQHAYGLDSTVIYPGVDTTIFCPQTSLKDRALRAESILIIGNDEPQKRLSLAIRAVGQLPARTRPSMILVCPRQHPDPKLYNIAKRHGVKLSVHVGIKDSELASLYRSAKLTLITALREPFGLSAAESLACGTPVVAVAEGGVTEIIQDGVNGYMVEDNVRAISQGIAKALGKGKLPPVSNRFTQAKSTKQLLTELRTVLS